MKFKVTKRGREKLILKSLICGNRWGVWRIIGVAVFYLDLVNEVLALIFHDEFLYLSHFVSHGVLPGGNLTSGLMLLFLKKHSFLNGMSCVVLYYEEFLGEAASEVQTVRIIQIHLDRIFSQLVS